MSTADKLKQIYKTPAEPKEIIAMLKEAEEQDRLHIRAAPEWHGKKIVLWRIEATIKPKEL